MNLCSNVYIDDIGEGLSSGCIGRDNLALGASSFFKKISFDGWLRDEMEMAHQFTSNEEMEIPEKCSRQVEQTLDPALR